MKRSLVVAGTLADAATVLAPLPAHTRQAPVLTVVAVCDASCPQEVTLNGATVDVGFGVDTTEATTVTVTASGAGRATFRAKGEVVPKGEHGDGNLLDPAAK